MEFTPVTTLHRRNISCISEEDLCLICHEKTNECLVKNKQEGCISDIINQCEEHQQYKTGKYITLHNLIKTKASMNYNHTVTIIPVRNHMEKIIFMLNEQGKHEIESLMCSRLIPVESQDHR